MQQDASSEPKNVSEPVKPLEPVELVEPVETVEIETVEVEPVEPDKEETENEDSDQETKLVFSSTRSEDAGTLTQATLHFDFMCSSTLVPPKAYDLRERAIASLDVFNQGECGACWAFATSATLADRYGWFMNQKPEQLSAEYMLACAATYGTLSEKGRGDLRGCEGGAVEQAWFFLANFGTVKNSCVQYTVKDKLSFDSSLDDVCNISVCPDSGEPSYMYRASVAYLIAGAAHQDGSESYIRSDMYRNGPVTTTMRIYTDFSQYWISLLNNDPNAVQVYAYDGISDLQGYHAVIFVGWGTTTKGEDYWILRNTWGRTSVDATDWAHNGYFCMRRGTNECDIEQNAVSGMPLVQPGGVSPFRLPPILEPLSDKCQCKVIPITSEVMTKTNFKPMVHINIPNRHPNALPPPSKFSALNSSPRVCPADQPKRCTDVLGTQNGLCATSQVDCVTPYVFGKQSAVVIAMLSIALGLCLVGIVVIVVLSKTRARVRNNKLSRFPA